VRTAKRFDVVFSSDRFNLSERREHFINECCYGDDVAGWLAQRLRQRGFEVAEPDQEDWGWYFDVRCPEATYFVGVGGTPDAEAPSANPGEWRLMIEKHRSLKERLLRTNLIDADSDPFLQVLREVLSAEPGLAFVVIE
jgi:hypothetical protein